MSLSVLIPSALVGAAVSGILGMGGGAMLLAIMATTLDPRVVVPVHGVVQMVSNGTRSFVLLRNVKWSIVARYLPLMLVGAWLGIQLYRGERLPWFKPAVGAFILTSLLWQRFKPARRMLPLWVFVPAGLGGGFLTIVVGASGPYLAAFFLRDDLDRRQIVATKATIQSFGHLLKIPAFLSIGFRFEEHLSTIFPLILCVIVGTFAGTYLLGRLPEKTFRGLFRVVLGLLGLRLVLSPWI